MSCKLKKLVTFEDKLSTIKNILFADDLDSPVPSSIDDWPSSSFQSDLDGDSSKVKLPGSLNDCLISTSPTADIIVFANDKNVAVYRYREEAETQICGTTLFELEPGEKITCVTCLPFVSQQISNQGGLDWCSIILGFSSGFIRVYTENMSLLLSQKISSEPVTNIKINSFFCPYTSGRTRHSDCSKNVDEIFVFCRTVCIIIEGFVFYQTLRSCRNYLARNQGQSIPDPNISPEFSLRFKRWQFKDFNRILDADNCGSQEISDYDYLVSRSITKGTFANPYNRRNNGNLIISAGEDPFVGLRRADETDSTSVLEEMTQAVVNKVKNVLPTFLRSSDKPKPKIDPPLEFSSNLEFYDQYRVGMSITISPTRELATVCDDFGRVCLVNLNDGLVIRMWKGYRDAQCGWIESYEDSSDIHSRKALFLCIYAPKRGLLELWRCQHGPRVEAFNVGKSCRLLYCGYSMLGLNDVLIKQYRQNLGLYLQSPGSCYLFDYKSCTMFTFKVPFVVSLTDRFSQSSKDELLFKEFKNISFDVNNFASYVSLFEKIKSIKIKWLAIRHVIDNSFVTLVKDLCQNLLSSLPIDLENIENAPNIEPSILSSARRCQKLIQLCDFYSSFHDLASKIDKIEIVNSIHQDPPDIENQAELLGWSARDYARFVSIFGFKEVVLPGKMVSFSPDFISFADLVDFFLPNEPETYQKSRMMRRPSPKLFKKPSRQYKIDQLYKVGDLILFPGLVTDNLETCTNYIEKTNLITHQELLYCVFASWLHTDFSADWRHWPRFNRYVLLLIDLMRQQNSTKQDYWLEILKTLCSLIAQATIIPSALISSMTLLTFYSQYDLCEETSKKLSLKDKSEEVDMPEEWESLSIVKEKLNLLINQLESTFFLDLALHSNLNYNPGDISLAYLRESLPGIVSESIAKCAISYPLEPSIILSLENDEFDEENPTPQQISTATDAVTLVEPNSIDTEVIKQLLHKVHDHFPHSMDCDTLLANCAWECLILWDKDPTTDATTQLLSQSLKYLGPVSSALLKHNLACLMWKIAIRKRMELLCCLIEKMGKTPKDRILKRDFGFDESSLEDFIKFVVELIDIITYTLGPSEADAMPIFRLDDWWKHKNWSNSQFPLTFVAIQQKQADPDLIYQVYDLCLIVNLIVNFQMKQHKPLSLFPFDVQKAFFGELSNPLKNIQADSLITENREKFLQSAASAVAYSVPPSMSLIEEEVQLYSTANRWIGKIVSLSKNWDIQPDIVRRRYICDLYSNCCDALAQEAMNMVNDREELAVALLAVAGQRINHLIKPVKDKFLASTPTYIISWLENLQTKNSLNLNFNAASTAKMLEFITLFIPSENSKCRIAKNLLTIANSLID
ncbi:rab3 GTPase-activating protein non-catalytic subunit isoform X2 [Tetranychus urticae]|uniref:rab3 GTPase-activating protein non-catalytic subunit isoform X2 n=1 Tax=Tetranychus urticae TaxID=32264 RepID=UPI00077B9367|nr:rab3 GTPase-activating protein non-catalytic subunit isoform X2 [Tetranychus urticae]